MIKKVVKVLLLVLLLIVLVGVGLWATYVFKPDLVNKYYQEYREDFINKNTVPIGFVNANPDKFMFGGKELLSSKYYDLKVGDYVVKVPSMEGSYINTNYEDALYSDDNSYYISVTSNGDVNNSEKIKTKSINLGIKMPRVIEVVMPKSTDALYIVCYTKDAYKTFSNYSWDSMKYSKYTELDMHDYNLVLESKTVEWSGEFIKGVNMDYEPLMDTGWIYYPIPHRRSLIDTFEYTYNMYSLMTSYGYDLETYSKATDMVYLKFTNGVNILLHQVTSNSIDVYIYKSEV